MAHFFIPTEEIKSFYETTTNGGYLHAWKVTVHVDDRRKIGLFGGYDRGVPLAIRSNNPGVIAFEEPPKSLASGDRFIIINGKKPGFTILDAGNGPKPWCSLQVQVIPKPFTPLIPEWKLYRMAADYYDQVYTSKINVDQYCRKWNITDDIYGTLLGTFRERGYGREYWEKLNTERPTISVQTQDFLVIGIGGIVTKDSNYGDIVLGLRIQSIQPHSGIGSIAGAIARIFTSDPNVIGVIEASGDLIEIGASGFAVVRSNQAAVKPVKMPTNTIQQRRVVGNLFRDRVFDELKRMNTGTGYTVEKEVAFETELGTRYADVVLRDSKGKIVAAFECKTGKGSFIKEQFRKDTELYIENNIRTIKITEDFFFVPE